MEDFSAYTFDKILMRDDFILSIEKTDPDAVKFWEQLCAQYPAVKKEYESAARLYHHFKSHQRQLPSIETREKVLNKILKQIDSDSREGKQVLLAPWLKVAAVIVAILGISSVLYFTFTNKSSESTIVYNEIIVPSGEKSQVILSDGTTVWLNSESKLRYPAQFEKDSRKVYLEGEGYFDVTKQKGSHFFVLSQNMKIEVLGTVFNVKSYPGDKTIETTVVEGKVKVQLSDKSKKVNEVVLLPTERVVYYKSNEETQKISDTQSEEKTQTAENITTTISPIEVQRVNTKNITSWKDHLLVFDNETLENIVVKMSRWYRTDVIISDSTLKTERFTGKFVHNETLEQVLKAINLTTPIYYEVTNDKVVINKKYRKRP